MISKIKEMIAANKAYNMVCGKRNNKILKQRLETEFGDLIKKYVSRNICESCDDEVSLYVWVCWWQGEKNMPPLVKVCYEQIKKMNVEKQVVLITQENLNNWVEFPDHIMRKFLDGDITMTHMSDLLRCELLKQYGGVWMDITILQTEKIPDKCYQIPIYSCKTKPEKWSFNVSRNRWTSFFWVSRYPENILFQFMSEFWNLYWKKYDELIEYFLIDFVIALANDNIPVIRDEISMIDLNGCGSDCWQLLNQIRAHNVYDEKRFSEIQQDGWFQKLSYKGEEVWKMDEKDTYYKHLLVQK